MKEEMPHEKPQNDNQKLIEMVKGNAAVINEIYDSVMAIRKAVSLIGSALGDMNIRLERSHNASNDDTH